MGIERPPYARPMAGSRYSTRVDREHAARYGGRGDSRRGRGRHAVRTKVAARRCRANHARGGALGGRRAGGGRARDRRRMHARCGHRCDTSRRPRAAALLRPFRAGAGRTVRSRSRLTRGRQWRHCLAGGGGRSRGPRCDCCAECHRLSARAVAARRGDRARAAGASRAPRICSHVVAAGRRPSRRSHPGGRVTARQRVRRAQYRMLGGVALSALLWGAVLAMTVVSLAAGANAFVPLSAAAREIIIPLMIVSAAGGAGLVLWRGRAARSIERVAMWIEEREPSLNYVLVTAIDEVLAPLEQNRALHAAANGTDIDAIVRHAWQHSLGRAAIACVVLGAVLAVLGPGDLLRAAERELADRAMPAAPAPMRNRLLSLRARVAPPVYTRLPAQGIEEPSNVAALVGSRITFEGNGAASGIIASIGTRELSAMTGERGWLITETMPPDPTVLTLRDRGYRRLLALEPRADSAPAVRLHLPARDTTYQHVPKGTLA